MTNPVLVEVMRGRVVESRHRGAIAVLDGAGRVVLALGDIERPVFPRSAIKGLQALALVESGAADRFGFGDAELALAMASHHGEAAHVATARRMLEAAGLHEGCLECGPQWPMHMRDQAALHRAGGGPTRIHNNCSGKHAGFLCAAVALGHDPAGYVRPDHPTMREVVAAMEAVTGAPHREEMRGVDGCSIPTFAIPLRDLARGFARFATGEGLGPERAAAVRRLRAAAAAEPWMVAGTGGYCTRVMALLGDAAFVKYGAEAVYTAALPDRGFGVALKMDDGFSRAAEVAVGAVLQALLAIGPADPRFETMSSLVRPPILSRNGEVVGEMVPSVDLLAALRSAGP